VTTALRAISVLILGITALTISTASKGTILSDIFAGYFVTPAGYKQTTNGTYVTAAIVMSMLVIPIIARATEEGCRSLPKEIREGSIGLGATEGFTLTHLIVPWSLPNIVTGFLLAAAESAGSVAVLLFIAGTGETGVGPLNQVTSLAYLIFGSEYGHGAFKSSMGPYQFSAGVLLLVITMGLSASGLILKRRLMRRFRGNPNG
jgi:ABC-type phosphate transport system permease subunit